MLKKLLFSLLCIGILQNVHAAHPLVTDDTGTQDAGNHQWEVNTDWLKHLGGSTERFYAATYTYGALKNLDVIISSGLSAYSPSGIRDTSLGAKWRFYESGATSLALKPELILPSGDTDKGLGNGRVNAALTLIGSYDAAPWAFHANLAASTNHYRNQADQDANHRFLYRASVAAMYSVNEQWRLVADTGVAHNPDWTSSTHPAYILLGTIYSPSKSIDFDVGLKYGLNKAEVRHQIGAGLTWRH